jgi:hypothetical protein
MAADVFPKAFYNVVTFDDVWEKISGERKTLSEIEKTLEEKIERAGDVVSKLNQLEDDAAVLAQRDQEAFIQAKYGFQGITYPGCENLEIWKAARVKGQEMERGGGLRQEPETLQQTEAAKQTGRDRLAEDLKRSWGEGIQVLEAQEGHVYSGYIFEAKNNHAPQIISREKDDNGQYVSQFVIHDLEKAPELGYQTLVHPGEPMIVTYENGKCTSTYVPYEEFRELHEQARGKQTLVEAEEIYRQAQKEQTPAPDGRQELDRLTAELEKDERVLGKKFKIIEAQEDQTYIGHITHYGKEYAIQAIEQDVRVIHDLEKTPELKRHAYFPGTVCVSRGHDGKCEITLGEEAIAAKQARGERTHKEHEAAAAPSGMALNFAADFRVTRIEHLDLNMEGCLTVTDKGGNRLDVVVDRDGRFCFESGRETALGYTGDETRYFKTEEAAVKYAQNWIEGHIRRVNEDYELFENRSVEGRHELLERLEKTPPQEWTETDYRRLLDVRNNLNSNFPMTLGLSPEETARQSELFNADVYFDPEVFTTWANKDLIKQAEELENEISVIDKSWDEGKFLTETEQEAAQQAINKLRERIDALTQEAEQDNERLKAENEKIADRAYKRVEELAADENAPELEDEMEEEIEVKENELETREDAFYEYPENRSVGGRYEFLERLEKTPSAEWTERDFRRLRDIEEKMNPEAAATWGLSPEETARRDAAGYSDKGETETRLEAENEKAYSKARNKVEVMVSEAEAAETKSLEEVSSSAKQKPRVSLVGQEGNVFNLLSVCVTALKQAGQEAEAEELSKRAFTCGSFDNAVSLMMEYVDEESLSPASQSHTAVNTRNREKQALDAAAEKEPASPALLREEQAVKRVSEDSHTRGTRISTEKIIEMHEFLSKCGSEEEAKKYLTDQKLTIPDLKRLAEHNNGSSYSSDRRKEDVINSIVKQNVGFRLEFASVMNFKSRGLAEEAALREMEPESFVVRAPRMTPDTRNGKIVAAVESDSEIVFVQQLADNKKLGVMYYIDPKDIPPGLNIKVGANLAVTKGHNGEITVKELEERGSTEKTSGMEEKENTRNSEKQALDARQEEAQAQRAEEIAAKAAAAPRGVESDLPFSIDKARTEVRDMRAAAVEKETASSTPLSEERASKQVSEDSHAQGTRLSTEKIIEIHEFLEKCNSKEEAKKYLTEQKLTIPDLKRLAEHNNGSSYSLNRRKEDIIGSIVRNSVGFRLEYASAMNFTASAMNFISKEKEAAAAPRGVESDLPFTIDKARTEVRDVRAAAAEQESASPTPLSEEQAVKQVSEDSHTRGTRISAEKIIEMHEFLSKCGSEEEAKKYLTEQKLTIPDLKRLAEHNNGLSYWSDRRKEDVINSIVRDNVGFRLEYASIMNFRSSEEIAEETALREMPPESFVTEVSHMKPAVRNGKVIAVVENDSDIVFVQQLAGDKTLGVMYHMTPKDIPPGLNITVGASLAVTKDRSGDITVKALEERGSTEKAREMEEKELTH